MASSRSRPRSPARQEGLDPSFWHESSRVPWAGHAGTASLEVLRMWHRQSSGVAALRDGLSHLPPGAEKAALSYVDMVARLSLPGGSMAGDSLVTRLA